jgi:hypothetical protein
MYVNQKVARIIIKHISVKQRVPTLLEEYLRYWASLKLPSTVEQIAHTDVG